MYTRIVQIIFKITDIQESYREFIRLQIYKIHIEII